MDRPVDRIGLNKVRFLGNDTCQQISPRIRSTRRAAQVSFWSYVLGADKNLYLFHHVIASCVARLFICRLREDWQLRKLTPWCTCSHASRMIVEDWFRVEEDCWCSGLIFFKSRKGIERRRGS
jgi:hypothetical protein